MKIKIISLEKKQDPRGWLIENKCNIVKDSIKHFLLSVSKKGAIRGQHYHKRKTEWLIVIKGTARIYFENVKNKEKTRVVADGNKPQIIEAEPFIAHSLKNIGKSEMYLMAIVNESLNNKDPDTFPYKVI